MTGLAQRSRSLEDQADRQVFAIDKRVDLGRAAAAANADGLRLLTSFCAPDAARCALTMVESTKNRPSRDLAAKVSKICLHTPRRDQRLKRL
jgi:hypothetical protein